MLNRQIILVTFLSSICVVGCGKKNEVPTEVAPSQESAVNNQAVDQNPAQSTVAEVEDPEIEKKRQAIEFALKEEEIKNDAKGQWAISATASSSYGINDPMQATGAPNTEGYGDSSDAWTTNEADLGVEWIELEYAKQVKPTEIRIRQNYNPGAIIKIDIVDESGAAHTVWKGPDMTSYPADQISWLNAAIEKTEFKTQKVKITLATNSVKGWNAIDAVQLVGEE